MSFARSLVAGFALLVPVLIVPACGGRQSQADAVVEANRRLDGVWVLRNFTPSETLEAPLQSLLAVQFNTLTVRFDGQNLYATGPGVNVTRRYQITEAAADQISLMVYEQTGVWYRISGQFQGNQLSFIGYDSPWRGRGVLERMQ
jgi:hypothetical protein